MPSVNRRTFLGDTLGTLVTMSLLETIFGHELLGAEVRPAAASWLRDIEQLGQDLKGQKLEQLVWQQKVEELFRQVPLDDVLALIDFDKLASGIKFVDNGALSLRFKFPEVEGVPKNLVYGKQIFALKKDRSVVPHGHNNMATAFLILKGDLRGRHYDRIRTRPSITSSNRRATRSFRQANAQPSRLQRERALVQSDHRAGVHLQPARAASEPRQSRADGQAVP